MKISQLLLATALLAAVNAQFVFKGETNKDSWNTMSPPNSEEWLPKNKAGAILGFGVFGVAYLIVVVMIFIDIDKRDKMYDQDIADDMVKMKELGLDRKMEEFNAELVLRFAGTKKDDGTDDQLIENAKALTADQFKKNM